MNHNYLTKTLEWGYNNPGTATTYNSMLEYLQQAGYALPDGTKNNFTNWFFSNYCNEFTITYINPIEKIPPDHLVKRHGDAGVRITPDAYMSYQRMLEQDQASEDNKAALKIAEGSRRLAWYAMWLGIIIGLVQIFIAIVLK